MPLFSRLVSVVCGHAAPSRSRSHRVGSNRGQEVEHNLNWYIGSSGSEGKGYVSMLLSAIVPTATLREAFVRVSIRKGPLR